MVESRGHSESPSRFEDCHRNASRGDSDTSRKRVGRRVEVAECRPPPYRCLLVPLTRPFRKAERRQVGRRRAMLDIRDELRSIDRREGARSGMERSCLRREAMSIGKCRDAMRD